MKGLKILLFVSLCLALGAGMASANINVDEDFDVDSSPFQDLKGTATLISQSDTVHGINVLATTPGSSPAAMQYNPTSALTQGTLFNQGPAGTFGQAKVWKLASGEQLKWGQVGAAAGGETSGLGTWGDYGGGIEVMQVAVAVEPASALKTAGTDLGQIKYLFANTTTHTLEYKLVATGTAVDIQEVRDGGAPTVVKAGLAGDRWAQITTVMTGNTGAPNNWCDYPSTAGLPNKGWPTNTKLTSNTIFMAYTFVDAMPLGTAANPAYNVDNPWRINGITANNVVRTVRYAAGPADALYLDNLYGEASIRSGESAADVNEWIAIKRSNKFNRAYPVPGGVPVELSVFKVH